MYVLIPGRHHVVTNFQFQYLYRFIHSRLKGERDQNGKPFPEARIDGIIFAVTSANHQGTRRNPLSYTVRVMAIQEFSHDLSVPVYCFPITDVGQLSDFASYTIKSIKHQAEELFELSPDNCIVSCSTEVGKLYAEIGYRIFGAECSVDAGTPVYNPWELIEIIAEDEDWESNRTILDALHPSSYKILKQYNLGRRIQFLLSDPITSDDGDLTDTRDYSSYVRQMDENAHIKWKDVAPYIEKGRIGDIGCATGSWLKYAAADQELRESDFFGIELTRQLCDICNQRKDNGEFQNPNIWFAQKNAVSGLVFKKGSMNTIHSSSLTHEIESYGSHEQLLQFIRNRFDELQPGGVWINRDVIGPDGKEKVILMKLNGSDAAISESVRFSGISTQQLFLQFASDFRKEEGYTLQYELIHENDQTFVQLKLEDAAEFMLTKDYTDNWDSEMHERFCFWSLAEWITALKTVGFEICEGTRSFCNPWIRENRFEGKVELFSLQKEPLEYPPTNMIVMARKPL